MRSGFSLIELVVVMAILGVVAAVAVPTLSGAAAGQRAEMAAMRVSSDLSLVEDMALSGSRSYTLTFDSNALSYAIKGDSASVVSLSREPYGLTGLEVAFGDAGTNEVTVDGYGAWSDAGLVKLTSGKSTAYLVVGSAERDVVDDPGLIEETLDKLGVDDVIGGLGGLLGGGK